MKKLFFAILILIFNTKITAQVAPIVNGYIIQSNQANIAQIAKLDKAQILAMVQAGPKNSNGALENLYLGASVPIFKNSFIKLGYSDFGYKLLQQKTFEIGLAQKFQLSSKSYLSIGINTAIAHSNFNFESDYGISFASKEALPTKDPNNTSIKTNSLSPLREFDKNQTLVGAGIFFNYDSWQISLAIPNLIKNKQPTQTYPYTEALLERPAYIGVGHDFKFSKKIKLNSGVNYRFSQEPTQKGLDVQGLLKYNNRFGLGLAQQRIGAISGKKPLLLMAEAVIKNATLAYSINIKDNTEFTNIKQQVLLKLDIDLLTKKEVNQAK